MSSLGIDVGGTRIKLVLRAADGEDIRQVVDTPAAMRTQPASVLAEVIDRIDPDRAMDVVGVAVPGIVDEDQGMATWSVNLDWRDLPLRDELESATGRRAVLAHDVRAGLLAEMTLGAGQGYDNVLFVPLGTGVAAAGARGGRVLGGDVFPGEIGHEPVDPDGPWCECGRRGCLEAIIGGRALAARWANESGSDGGARDLLACAAAGDAVAGRLWAEAVGALATALVGPVRELHPELVLIGGGFAQSGDVVLDPIRRQLAAALGGPVATGGTAARGAAPGPAVRAAELGEWAGAYGAMLRAQWAAT